MSVATLVKDALLQVDRAHANGSSLGDLRTGLPELDRLLRDVVPGQLVLVASRPSMGRSALAMQIARNVAADPSRPVLCFCLQTSVERAVQRLLCQEGRIDSTAMRGGFLTERDWPALVRAAARISSSQLFLHHPIGASVEECCSIARRLKSDRAPDLALIVLDGIEDLEPRSLDAPRVGKVAEACRVLRSLAHELECVVLASCAVARACDERADSRPIVIDLPAHVETFADVVMFVYRDEAYFPETSDRGLAELIVAKNSTGPIGCARVRFEPASGRFGDK